MAATLASAPVRASVPYRQDQRFFNRFALALSLLIVFSFAQFAVRGFSNPSTAPWWVHVHGVVMLGWLGLLVKFYLSSESHPKKDKLGPNTRHDKKVRIPLF